MYLLKETVLVIIYFNSCLYKTIKTDEFNSTSESTKDYSSLNFTTENAVKRNNDKTISDKAIRLKNIEIDLWRFIPPILVTIGVIGNTLTILVLRR